MWRKILVLVAVGSLYACSWVTLTPQGEKVRVLSAEEVTKCQHLGRTTVSVRDKLVGDLERDREKVQSELNLLARNSAVDLKGDTVVPVGSPANGRQVFQVYRCMP